MRRLEVRFGEMYGKVCWKEDWYILSRVIIIDGVVIV